MKAKGRIDPNQLAKLGFDMKPKEEVSEISYIPKRDVDNDYFKLKNPYPKTGGKVGHGKHGRSISNTGNYRSEGNRSARERQNRGNNLRGSHMGTMKH